MTQIISPWIPGFTAARCGQCGGIFDSALGNCPKGDSGESGWYPVNNTKGRDEIKRLRDQIAWVNAALLQIKVGRHSIEFAKRLATKALDYLKNETAPAGTSAAEPRKEQTN